MATRGFVGRQSGADHADRIPPGQHLVEYFPVLTAGPTPRIELEDWQFTLKVGPRPVKVWSWAEFNALPRTSMTRDIHCVTSWSKLDTQWEGVTIEDILADAGLSPPTGFVLAHCFDGYSTNVPLADLTSGKAMVALNYQGEALPRDHGGPARPRRRSVALLPRRRPDRRRDRAARAARRSFRLAGYHRRTGAPDRCGLQRSAADGDDTPTELRQANHALEKAGGQPLTTRYWIPDAAFDNGGVGLFSALEIVESVEISLYLIGVSAYARVRDELGARMCAEAMGTEAVHRALVRFAQAQRGTDRGRRGACRIR